MNAVWNSYGQLCGCPEIFKKSCKFFCRELDIRVTQIVEADAGESCPLEQRLHVAIGCIGVDWIFRLHRIREYPLTDGIHFSPP